MAANILVVDDSGTMRGMIKRTLAISGLDVAEVYEAANGIEALAQMAEHPISLVLLDINMPVMNGLQLLARIHDDPGRRPPPFLLASPDGSNPRLRALLRAGARGYVRNPSRPEQLRDLLTPIVGARPHPAPSNADLDGGAFWESQRAAQCARRRRAHWRRTLFHLGGRGVIDAPATPHQPTRLDFRPETKSTP